MDSITSVQSPQSFINTAKENCPSSGCAISDKWKKEFAVSGTIFSIALSILLTQDSYSLYALTAKDMMTNLGKSQLKKGEIPKVVSYPLLMSLGGICLLDPTGVSSDIFFNLASKHLCRDMKDWIKGHTFQEIMLDGWEVNKARCLRLCGQNSEDSGINLDAMGDDEDSDSEERIPPPVWQQALLISAVAAAAFAAYALSPAGTPLFAMTLVSGLSKMVTVACRQLPLVPAGIVGGSISAVGAIADALFHQLPVKLFPPLSTFSLGMANDTAKQYLRGKLEKRPWIPESCSMTAQDEDELGAMQTTAEKEQQEIAPEEEVHLLVDDLMNELQNLEKSSENEENALQEIDTNTEVQIDHQSQPVDLLEIPKEKKKDKEPLPAYKRMAITLASLAYATFANFVEPKGGILVKAGTDSLSGIIDECWIKKNDDASHLLLRTLAIYPIMMGLAVGVDKGLAQVLTGEIGQLSTVIGNVALKLFVTKEIKNLSNVDLSAGVENLKEKSYQAWNWLWETEEEENNSLDSTESDENFCSVDFSAGIESLKDQCYQNWNWFWEPEKVDSSSPESTANNESFLIQL